MINKLFTISGKEGAFLVVFFVPKVMNWDLLSPWSRQLILNQPDMHLMSDFN